MWFALLGFCIIVIRTLTISESKRYDSQKHPKNIHGIATFFVFADNELSVICYRPFTLTGISELVVEPSPSWP